MPQPTNWTPSSRALNLLSDSVVANPLQAVIETQRTEDVRLSDMVSILTHRISSLTVGVQGYAELLVESLATAEQRKLVRSILEGMSRIESVLADLRLFAQPITPFPIPLSIDHVVADAVSLLPERFQGRLHVSTEVRRDVRLNADPELSRQALFAVIKNALEATPKNGEARLHVLAWDDGFVEFVVENEGSPILPEAAPRIFDPFFTTKAQNLGLGLALARTFARAQGGGLELASVSSEPTTRFVLSIPTTSTDKS